MKKLKKIFGVVLITIFSAFIGINSLYAASATIKTSTSSTKVVVGKTFNVTVKVSSSALLGSWEYTIDYDSSILSLVSGTKSVVDYGNGSKKSASYSYTFKAIKSGKSKISVKSYNVIGWDELGMSASPSGTNVTVITQSQLEASYSKDNNLSALTIDGAELSPAFSKDVTDYTVSLNPGVTSININATKSDSGARTEGTGTFEVIEGENKFAITVTAENGSTKTYNIVANVIDPSPIKVKTVENEELTVVKRSAALTIPDNYTETTVKINEQDVPAFTNEITKFTLVGLKDTSGNIGLYIYGESNNTFKKYAEVKLNELVLYPLNVENEEKFGYKKSLIKINDYEFYGYKYKKDSNFAIIEAVDTETGETNFYMYDIKNNTATFYNSELVDDLKETINTYYIVIITLTAESTILFIVFICILIKKIRKNKKRKKHIEAEKEKVTEEKTNVETKEKIESKDDKPLVKESTKKEKKKSKKKKEKEIITDSNV